MMTLGEGLIRLLESYGVEVVFGIPGVHTVELYRGLAGSKIRHITPRHEQGAGFMADGYARVSGKPGVALVITGPGLTNIITAMGQALADSVPMLVISGVNKRSTLGKGMGYLHELPDQQAMLSNVSLFSARIDQPQDLEEAMHRAFSLFASGRGGPVHIEIPTDVMVLPVDDLKALPIADQMPVVRTDEIAEAAELLTRATRPVILVGGGAKYSEQALQLLAERLDAPVVQTVNARGLMHGHALTVPASPSLAAVRELIADADYVLALGTEFGPTDYDMYGDGSFAHPPRLIRVDIDAAQLARHRAILVLRGECGAFMRDILPGITQKQADGAARAQKARLEARVEIGEDQSWQVEMIEIIRDTLPGSIIVGDSTQPIYAGNLYYDHDRPGGWFNAATGFGALGYGPAAAIGAQSASPDAAIIALTGDGGFQFTLSELAAAVEEKLPVIFLVWNNHGYREIETSMRSVGVEPVGVSPAPPDFALIAQAYGMASFAVAKMDHLPSILRQVSGSGRACLIEIRPDLVG